LDNTRKLAQAGFDLTPLYGNALSPYYQGDTQGALLGTNQGLTYHEIIQRCRFFYENDTITGTVINRMCDITVTDIRNRHNKKYSDEIRNYYDGVAALLAPLLKQIPLSYLLDGIAIPDYKTDKIMGNRLHQKLGRTRYVIPKTLWMRNAENILIKKGSMGERILFLRIPRDDINFITNKGVPDREQEYEDLVRLYPDYVAAVNAGKTIFKLNAVPIMRRITSYNTYPLPFLKNTLPALEYKRSLKRMDKITAERVIQAIRQISVGNDEFPADDDDIIYAKQVLTSQSGLSGQESLLTIYTNHTIKVQWITPPLDNILNSDKYTEANADIFIGMGFPRLWAVGENERSNSGNGVGPIATIEAMRDDILEWVKELYQQLADLNGFTQYPTPYWTPVSTAAAMELLQYATNFVDTTISRDMVAQIYGSNYEQEHAQLEIESADRPQETVINEVGTTTQKPDPSASGDGMGSQNKKP
jgi:hypothetical protein